MTQIAADERRMRAAGSAAAKLQAFHDSLTPDEQQVLDSALRRAGAREDATMGDATGFLISVGQLPLIAVRIVELLHEQRAVSDQRR
jgi:hypothetical protein